MDFELQQFNGNNTGAFYIQCKGEHSGRPLITPIPNCFSVHTSDTLLIQKVFALYVSNQFQTLICGSVIPFIRIKDTRHFMGEQLPKFRAHHRAHLEKIQHIETILRHTHEKQRLLKQLQKAIVFEIIK